MTLDNVQALPNGTQLGDFRFDAMIGHGGFGITYRAFDGQLAKVVAVKEYLPVEFAVRRADGQVVPRGARYADDFAWGRERFLEEARALARFRHPHIVPVLRYFEANGTAYTVMEFEDGRSLAEVLKQTGRRLPPPDVLRLATGLLSGLSAVHAQGFLHRDIKPSNIMIRRDGVPILIDFGAARQAMGGRTRTLTSVLTPQYAPIEQYALDGKQGPWSDIYSAAAVLHHALAGTPPPEAASRIRDDPYRPLAVTQADRFEQPFLAAIDQALAFAPEHRPQTIEAWQALFGSTLVDTTQTQRMPAAPGTTTTTPRLGGAYRGEEVMPPPPPPEPRGLPVKLIALLALVVIAIGLIFVKPKLDMMMAGAPAEQTAASSVPTPTPVQPASPSPSPSRPPVPQTSTPAAPAPEPNKALIDKAQHAAEEARAIADKANDAAATARTMAGEARITAARAAQASLENARRVTSDDGANYVGQLADGKRQGLGVAETKDGDRRAGEWQDDKMSGRGTRKLSDGVRYEGQWRDNQPSGLGVVEQPGVEREEGTFGEGKFEGPGLRRSLADPVTVQLGEWHNSVLDGPGVETVGDKERYEGSFRAGKRNGYGQLTGADKKVTSGRWTDGKLVESVP